MSNEPYPEQAQFTVPYQDENAVYDSLTDLLDHDWDDGVVVFIWPNGPGKHYGGQRSTIAALRQQRDDWEAAQKRAAAAALIDKADTYTFKGSELTLEWGWRLRDVPGPELVYQVSEEDARRAVASNPRLFELVARQVTAWELAE